MIASLSNKAMRAPVKEEDVWVHSACEMCYSSCGILVHRVNGVVVKIEGDPDCPHNNGKLCAKGQAGLMSLYDPNRVKFPLKRINPEKDIGVDPKWQRISWDEALEIISERLKKVRSEDPKLLIFANWDAAVFAQSLLPSWMSAFGTAGPRLLNAYRCGSTMHSVSYLTNGTFHNEIDFDYCNYCMLFGNQMGFMVGLAPNIMAQKMAEARSRGMKLVVIDPICTKAASKADEWIPIRPGTDGALALAMLQVLLNELGLYDDEFIKKHTNGPYLIAPDGHYARDKETNKPLVWDNVEGKASPFDAEVKGFAIEGSYIVDGVECHPGFQLLKEQVKKYTPEVVSPITTIPADTIRRLAIEFGQAAKIGSKIVIEGKELPYRPAAVNYYRGVTARKHGSIAGLSIALLNLVVGAFLVPGGHTGVNLVGPANAPSSFWSFAPRQDPDGLLVPSQYIGRGFNPYDINPKSPDELGIRSFLPLAAGGGVGDYLSILEPDKFRSPVRPEVLIHCRTNLMMSRENLKAASETLRKIPFIVSFAIQMDEVTEFADVVLPDTHTLERLVWEPNRAILAVNNITGYWYWGLIQPVVEPAYEARHWWEVLLELADRVGFQKDYYKMINLMLLKEPYKLDVERKYTLEEITDRRLKSEFGPEHGVQWFKEHGYLTQKRRPEERYAFLALRSRVPVYFENYLRAGEAVKRVTQELDIPWDTSDYIPLPDWKPNPAYEKRSPDYDLFCVNYKTPIHYQSFTTENAWLNELAEYHPYYYKILLYTETAKRKGIKDGDTIWVESIAGKVKGKAKVTECIHPEVVGIAGTFGSWAKGKPIALGKGVHHNSLIPLNLERIEGVTAAVDDCIEVKIYKAEK